MTTFTPDLILAGLPDTLRKPLLDEYRKVLTSFMERRWDAAELSGGRFCEVVYAILDGYARNEYPTALSKPANFVDACRRLESNGHVPRGFQILIPRLLLGLYEIRNNRNVGHVGGDVSPDFMDSAAVIAIAGWILAEIIRVYHRVSTEEAQRAVDSLAERRLPLIWKSGEIRRVLNPEVPLKHQILLLLSSESGPVAFGNLVSWTECKNRTYFTKVIRRLHSDRLVEFHRSARNVEISPAGTNEAAKLIAEYTGLFTHGA